MLQFITHPSDRFPIVDEVKMAIAGGCRWVQLRMKEASDNEVRRVAEELIPLCQEAGVILVLEDRVELTMELRVHGVHLGKEDMPVAEARQYLGPHAIIGATANTAADILALRDQDVDYVGLGPFRHTETKRRLAPLLGLDGYRSVMEEIRREGIDLPVVAIGGITLDDVDDVMATGVSGIAMSGAIINAADPAAYTASVIEKLDRYRK